MTRFEQLVKNYVLERYGYTLLEADDGTDILPDNQPSGMPDTESGPSDDVKKIIYLTNILLNALKFKPSDEVVAYLNMPRFIRLSNREKLITVKNLLADHPEMIVQEAEGDEEEPVEDETVDPEEEVVDFGNEEMGDVGVELDESGEKTLLNLIMRVIKMDPHSLPQTIKNLPMEANEDNYGEIIEKIESILV